MLREIVPRLPMSFGTYLEPFLGGGAVFFHLSRSGRIQNALLSDINSDLIAFYTAVRNDPDALSDAIDALKLSNSSQDYYIARRLFNGLTNNDTLRRSALLIYLNHHCYNGLQRYNSRGEFNVPFGKYSNPSMPGREELRQFSGMLRKASLEVSDFSEILTRARKGDFVYLDPPYFPLSKSSSFTAYTKNGFSRADQERLASVCRNMDSRGVKFMLSHSATDPVRELFSGFNIEEIKARRAINSVGTGRSPVSELIITNYNPPWITRT